MDLHKRLSILGCSTLPVILNLHYFKRDSYIYRQLQCLRMSGLQKPVCGYPPSISEESKYRKRHSGIVTKENDNEVPKQ